MDANGSLRFIRSCEVQSACWKYREHVVDYAMTFAGSERAGRELIDRAFDAMLEGRYPVPMNDPFSGLRAIIAKVAR